jgi:hypothetical protein
MRAGGQASAIPAETREAILQDWLVQAAHTYPEQAVQTLLDVRDPFHNAVGCALHEGLPVLLDAVLADRWPEGPETVLDRLVRIRAVQDFSASRAVSFLLLLKPVLRARLRESGCEIEVLEDRVDRLMLMAFDLFTDCRDRTRQIQLNEARRSVYVADRVSAARGRHEGPGL